jgi:hypothetical protein
MRTSSASLVGGRIVAEPVPFRPRDPGCVKNQDSDPDPGSGSGMNIIPALRENVPF